MAELHTAIQLEGIARTMRRETVELCYRSPAHKAHLGGCLSAIEILTALYADVMNTGVGQTGEAWRRRDRFVLSKAHASLALYAALHQAGFLSDDEFALPVCGEDTLLFRQARRDLAHGMEISGGSLGMGMGYACGLALAQRRRGQDSRVFVLLGDGECNEGSVWESVAFAAHNRLTNLVAIVDANGLQLDGPIEKVLGGDNHAERWTSFGFDAIEAEGNDAAAVRDALLAARDSDSPRPRVVIARTAKGRGVSFAENHVEWHDNSLTDDLYRQAITELSDAAFETRGGDER